MGIASHLRSRSHPSHSRLAVPAQRGHPHQTAWASRPRPFLGSQVYSVVNMVPHFPLFVKHSYNNALSAGTAVT